VADDRFPFPVPYGWFCVGYPEDFPTGEPKAIYYFDRHLVAWRDDAGDLHVQDAFCPHLGAHLGHGGKVDGCELVCPFHGWKFDAAGDNTDIPYSTRTNRKGTLRTFPVVERNGTSMVWYHPDPEVAPLWEVPLVPEFNGDPEWSTVIRTEHEIEAAWQEMAENGVDSAHFRYVHNTAEVPELELYDTDTFPCSQMRSSQKFPTPRGVMEGRIDSKMVGPGLSIVEFSGIIDTLNLAVTTPISRERCIIRFNFAFKTMGDEATTRNVGNAFVREVDRQVVEDKPIWEHKAHLVRPALADGDGPFMKFRKWAAQFYAEPISDERLVFPPPWDPARADEAPAKATASAKLTEG
jgi:phenylpropionate dioxygenase-like ring-hydroxylating dioxygenase large terminal subunit